MLDPGSSSLMSVMKSGFKELAQGVDSSSSARAKAARQQGNAQSRDALPRPDLPRCARRSPWLVLHIPDPDP